VEEGDAQGIMFDYEITNDNEDSLAVCVAGELARHLTEILEIELSELDNKVH
tara:strand:- start:291 stop:446 length:156 start_codon:yes stop_codon:yes gene_type:complete